MLYCSILLFTVLWYSGLCYTVLHSTVYPILCCTTRVLYYPILYCTIRCFAALHGRYTILNYTVLSNAMLHDTGAILSYAILYYPVLSCAMLALYHAKLDYTILHHDMLCRAIIFQLMLCLAIPYCAVLRKDISCYTTSYFSLLFHAAALLCSLLRWHASFRRKK